MLKLAEDTFFSMKILLADMIVEQQTLFINDPNVRAQHALLGVNREQLNLLRKPK